MYCICINLALVVIRFSFSKPNLVFLSNYRYCKFNETNLINYLLFKAAEKSFKCLKFFDQFLSTNKCPKFYSEKINPDMKIEVTMAAENLIIIIERTYIAQYQYEISLMMLYKMQIICLCKHS